MTTTVSYRVASYGPDDEFVPGSECGTREEAVAQALDKSALWRHEIECIERTVTVVAIVEGERTKRGRRVR